MKIVDKTTVGNKVTYKVDGVDVDKATYDAAVKDNAAELAEQQAQQGGAPTIILGAPYDWNLTKGLTFQQRLDYLSKCSNVALNNGAVTSIRPAQQSDIQIVIGLNKRHPAWTDTAIGVVGEEREGRVKIDTSLLWTTPLSVCAVLTEQGLPDISLLIEAEPMLLASLFRSKTEGNRVQRAKAYFASIELHAGDVYANPWANKIKEGREPVKKLQYDNYLYKLDLVDEYVERLQAMYATEMGKRAIDKIGSAQSARARAVTFDVAEQAVAIAM
jgi:hypothetical protein